MNGHTLFWYFRIRPASLSDAIRFYIGLVSAFVFKAVGLQRISPRFPIPSLLIPGKAILHAKIDGFHVAFRPVDANILLGTHEPITTEWFAVQEGQTVVDVGAHVGHYVLKSSKASCIVAVEPDESNLAILHENVRQNGLTNVLVHSVALSNSSGKQLLHCHSGTNTGASSLESGWVIEQKGRPPKSIVIDCTTLDELMKLDNIEAIDWLKIDVEGHEVKVLEGARQALQKTKRLIIEVCDRNVDRVKELITKSGLSIVAEERGENMSNWLCIRGFAGTRYISLTETDTGNLYVPRSCCFV